MSEIVIGSDFVPLSGPLHGPIVQISGEIGGAECRREGAVVFAIEFDGTYSKDILRGCGIYHSDRVGPFVYMSCNETRPNTFSNFFCVPEGASLRGIRARRWNANVNAIIRNFKVMEKSFIDEGDEFIVNLSVDVEALPHRAARDHVDRLIYGRCDGSEYGIAMQMQLFKQLGIPATFYLELGACGLWGEEKLHEVGRIILDNGFDLQLHLHSEVLIRAMDWKWIGNARPDLAMLDAGLTRQCLEYTFQRFINIARKEPLAFRAGGFLFNRHTVDVGTSLGIKAFSNYRLDYPTLNRFDFTWDLPIGPFMWDTGAIELPVVFTADPLTSFTAEDCWRQILLNAHKNRTKMINVVIHSWSFMERGSNGYHERGEPRLEAALRKIIELAPRGIRFISLPEAICHYEARKDLLGAGKRTNELLDRTAINRSFFECDIGICP